MDGMGETYKAMLEDIGGVEVRTSTLICTFDYCGYECCRSNLLQAQAQHLWLDLELQW